MLVAVAAGMFIFCALSYASWHWYERRTCRGAHTRTDENYSVAAFIARTERRWAEEDAVRAATGSHHLSEQEDEPPIRLLSGETLLSGYYHQLDSERRWVTTGR
jgi:hypothetical protein